MNIDFYPQLKAKYYVVTFTPKTQPSDVYASDYLDYLKKFLAAKKILARKRLGLEQKKLTTEVNVLLSLTRKHRSSMKHFYALRRAAKLEERKTRKEK